MRSLRIRNYAEAEAQVIHLRGNPFDIVREACDVFRNPVRFAEHAMRQIDSKWRVVTLTEIFEWYSTCTGRIFSVWQCVRDNGVELNWVRENTLAEDESFWRQMETAIHQSSPFSEVSALDELARHRPEKEEKADASWWSIVRGFVEEYSRTFDEIGDMTIEQMNAMATERENLKEGVRGFGSQAELQDWMNWRNGRIREGARNIARGKHWNE